MTQLAAYWYEPVFPWTLTQNDRRFRRIVGFTLLLALVVGIIVPWLPSPEVERKELKEVAPRLAKLILENQKPPPPKPKPAVQKPKSKKKEVAKKKKTPPKKKPSARKKAERAGLMAMRDELADLRESFNVASLQKPLSRKAAAKARQPQKSQILTAKANQGSGGINTRQLSRATGGTQLASRATTGVSSTIGTDTSRSRRTARGQAARGEEEIELVFQRNKAAIFNLYNRALRRDPSLQGKVVLELTITPEGRVTHCRVISSELNNPALERKLAARVKLFRCSRRDVAAITVTYPIDFLPS